MSEVFENIFMKKLFGFRRCYSTQHSFWTMLENWKFDALLIDVSKKFDCLEHDLISLNAVLSFS